MSDLLSLKEHITYGPVRSRRLGRSLGINLLPPSRKTCTFDCVYCQYGWTPKNIDWLEQKQDFPALEKVVQDVEIALQKLIDPPAYLTFSGNGEPTLHPDFPDIVDAIAALRNRLAPRAKTALLSNAACLDSPEVRSAVMRLDRPILKFDAGNELMFRSFNRPVPGTSYSEMVSGLENMRDISLQSLFADGPGGNLDIRHIDDWIEQLRRIRPRDVQVYSLSRPVPSRSITPASREALLDIRSRVMQAGIAADIF